MDLFGQLDYKQYAATHCIWTRLQDLPYRYSTLCMVNNVLLAIGGKDNDGCSSMKTTAIYAFNELRWYHVGEMAVKAYWVDAVVLSDGDIVVVDGCSLAVMKGEAKGSHVNRYCAWPLIGSVILQCSQNFECRWEINSDMCVNTTMPL